MRKGHSIIGLQVLSQTEGTKLGKVLDLVFDHDANACIGLMLRDKSLFKSALVVAWDHIVTIGKDAVMVEAASTLVDPTTLPKFREVMAHDTHLSGTQIITEDGHTLGTFADIYVDEATGKVVGYEVSGGFVSDAMSGKRYVPAERTHEVRVGNDVLIASRDLSNEFERQGREEPGGLTPVLASAGEKVSDAYASAKDKVAQTYENVAEASVEKQKELVIGKTAGHDVFLPAPTMAAADIIVEDTAPILAAEAAIEEEDLRPEHGPLLVATGQTITAEQAHEAEQAGILHQLLLAAGVGATNNALQATHSQLAPNTDTSASGSLVGKTAQREVLLPTGSTLVAPGMVITSEIVELARQNGKENELANSIGNGNGAPLASPSPDTSSLHPIDNIGNSAFHMFDSIKNKVAEIAGTAQEKKANHDEASLQKKINNALGRPVTRIILDRSDALILNTGDIITNRSIERAREADMLDVLLDSVYASVPAITPDMMSLKEPGEASLPEQTRLESGPIVTRDPSEVAPSTTKDNAHTEGKEPQEQLERS